MITASLTLAYGFLMVGGIYFMFEGVEIAHRKFGWNVAASEVGDHLKQKWLEWKHRPSVLFGMRAAAVSALIVVAH